MLIRQTLVKNKNSMLDFNSILKWINVFLGILIVYLFLENGDNIYIDITTIVLGILLALENIMMLNYEKKTDNPFIIILVFLITFFYLLRICTLISVPYSETFIRDSISVEDLNYALIFILLSNVSMFSGFYFSSKLKMAKRVIPYSPYSSIHLRNLLIILLITIFLVFLSSKGITGGAVIIFLETVFFHQEVIILFTFCFLLYHFDRIPYKIRLFVSLLTIAFIIFVTLAGSRAAMLTAGYLILMSTLVVNKRVIVSKWIVISAIFLIPISVIFFIISTFNRDLETKETSVVKIVELMREEDIFEDKKIEFFLGRMYQRIGFLDYSTDLIAKPNYFKPAINPIYYTYSIIDNILTPGFDIFNTAKATNVIGMLAIGQPIPTKKQAEKSYQSDMMGIYGEYYVMFYGYPALLVFFLFSFFIQRIYNSFNLKDKLHVHFYQTFCLSIFFTWLNSFGTDWIIIEAVTLIITGKFIHRYYH